MSFYVGVPSAWRRYAAVLSPSFSDLCLAQGLYANPLTTTAAAAAEGRVNVYDQVPGTEIATDLHTKSHPCLPLLSFRE